MKSYTGWVGDPQTLVLQKLSHRSESSEPHVRVPGPGVRPSESLVCEGQCSLRAGAQQGFTCTRIRGETATPGEPGPKPPAGLRCPGDVRTGCGSLWRTRTLVTEAPGTTHWHELSRGSSSGLAPPAARRLRCWDTSKEPTSGWEHRPTHGQTGC